MSKLRRVPDALYSKIDRLGKELGIPNTKAFLVRDAVLEFRFKAKRMKSKGKSKSSFFILEVFDGKR